MKIYERTLSSKKIYEGRILDLDVKKVELINGKTSTREIVDHKDAAAILPIIDGQVVFVRQYRKAIESVITEIPAGLLDEGELPIEAAIRELQEEVGLIPLDLKELGSMWPSPGFCNEKTTIFLATEFSSNVLEPDEDEFLHIYRLPIKTVRALYVAGKFQDAKTACALGYYFSQC